MQSFMASVEEVIFMVGLVIAIMLLRVRYEDIDGNPVPVVIFKRQPSLFHAFLLATNFSFTAAFLTVNLRAKHPKMAWFSRRLAVVCMAVAAGVLSYSAVVSLAASRSALG